MIGQEEGLQGRLQWQTKRINIPKSTGGAETSTSEVTRRFFLKSFFFVSCHNEKETWPAGEFLINQN